MNLSQLVKKQVWGNGAIIVTPIDAAAPLELDHDDTLVVGHSTYSVFTLRGYFQKRREEALRSVAYCVKSSLPVRGYDLEYMQKNVDELVAESKAQNSENKDVGISGRSAVICSGLIFIEVAVGMLVRVEGSLYTIGASWNRNLCLVKVEDAAVAA